ncbi:MAG: class I SAM-dependent methyltransferase, partial [Clostridia bacterium]|nr:class I SAM-dependent methyltransferase [Clostridia bacterium]
MKDLPPLTPRLRAVASLVREGVNVADIGTDHAYLAVWLVRSGGCGRCIACDVNAGPLERARETLRAYGAQDRVELRLADGLDAVRAQEADDVVIAGMGGELIAEIIARCGWLRESSKHLVLQPMTAQPELRRALCRSGFEIVREGAAREGAKLYVVISAVFTGRVSEPDELFA